MTNNPNFETPLVTMAYLTTAQTDFSNALAAAVHGGKLATAQKKQRA